MNPLRTVQPNQLHTLLFLTITLCLAAVLFPDLAYTHASCGSGLHTYRIMTGGMVETGTVLLLK
jgi:hypothetical protein